MASSVIHICVAKKVIEKLNILDKTIYLGSIAPDINKYLCKNRCDSHFIINNEISLNKFLNKYKDKLDKGFMLGYYIHLYTDYIWYKYFTVKIINDNYIYLKDGTRVINNKENYSKYIYKNYDNLDSVLINEYKLDLSYFNEELKIYDIYMEEISLNKINLFVKHVYKMIENNKLYFNNEYYVFDIGEIKKFINMVSDIIYLNILELFKL